MAASIYEQYYRMDWGLPHYSPPLMAAIQDYRAQTTRLLEHQTHVQDIWSQDYQAHHPQ
ncbi:hypothetical protein A2U01_0073776, partial [Trifolium medium]|nr:hypothetical protein [Trifolium medium]